MRKLQVLVETVPQDHVSWVQGRVLECKIPSTYLVSVQCKTRFCHADHLRRSLLVNEEKVVPRQDLEVEQVPPLSPERESPISTPESIVPDIIEPQSSSPKKSTTT